MPSLPAVSVCLTFGLLGAAILAVWLPPLRLSGRQLAVWPALYAGAVLAGLATGLLSVVALLPLAALAGAALFTVRAAPGWQRGLGVGVTLLLGLALAMHAFPGFAFPTIVPPQVISPGAPPFSLRANFDKASVGLLLLALLCRRTTAGGWPETLRTTAVFAAATAAVVLGIGVLLHYVQWDPKWPAAAPWFLAFNLLSTCVAEEVFFRGVIQERLQGTLQSWRFSAWIALTVAAVLFGIVHFGGGWQLVMLATIEGLGAGWCYYRLRRIEGPILVHFAVNAAHFLGFTYPFLA